MKSLVLGYQGEGQTPTKVLAKPRQWPHSRQVLCQKRCIRGGICPVCHKSSLHSKNHHQLNIFPIAQLLIYWNTFPTPQNPLCSKHLQCKCFTEIANKNSFLLLTFPYRKENTHVSICPMKSDQLRLYWFTLSHFGDFHVSASEWSDNLSSNLNHLTAAPSSMNWASTDWEPLAFYSIHTANPVTGWPECWAQLPLFKLC